MNVNRSTPYLFLLVILLNQCSDVDELIPTCTTIIFPYEGCYVPENAVVNFSWAPSLHAASYDVYLGYGSDEPKLIGSEIATENFAYTIPQGLNVTYTWYVQPKNTSGSPVECAAPGSFVTKELPATDDIQKIVNVLVLNYDPDIAVNSVATKVTEFFHWNDPRSLANEYIHDVFASSGGLIKYNIAEWRDLNEFPVKKDGYAYNTEQYISCIQNSADCHASDGLDYYRMIKDQGVAVGINGDLFEEVWLFGGPYFGFSESAMAGPGAFYINGDILPSAPAKQAFVIMGFNYERDAREMLHNLCHRTESTMSMVYGGWQVETLTSSWARFAANNKQSNGIAAVGTCHYPPNALVDYDYANNNFVQSSADDWYKYPILTGNKRKTNSETWGGPDYEREYLKWWFSHLPRRQGTGPDKKINSWWRYIFGFNDTILK